MDLQINQRATPKPRSAGASDCNALIVMADMEGSGPQSVGPGERPWGEALAPEWDHAVGSLTGSAARRVVVLGAADVGKSTFCRHLLRAAVDRERSAVLIDADVGQKMVGPPAAVTQAEAGAPELLSDLAFVGTTDPVMGFSRIVTGLDRLSRDANCDLLVVNTSGLLSGVGRRLKTAKIAALAPDLLVAIGQDPALLATLADHPEIPRLNLASPAQARRKTLGQRRAARREAFRRHFEGSRVHDVPLGGGDITVLSERQLVGLVDRVGRDLGLGLVEAIYPDRARAHVWSPAPPEAVRGLVAGRVRLDQNFSPLLPAA